MLPGSWTCAWCTMVNPKGKTKCITCQKPAPKLLRPKRQAKRAMTSGGHQPRSGKLSRKNRYQDVASRKSTYRAAKGNEELPLGPESKAWVVNEGDFLARRIKQIAVRDQMNPIPKTIERILEAMNNGDEDEKDIARNQAMEWVKSREKLFFDEVKSRLEEEGENLEDVLTPEECKRWNTEELTLEDMENREIQEWKLILALSLHRQPEKGERLHVRFDDGTWYPGTVESCTPLAGKEGKEGDQEQSDKKKGPLELAKLAYKITIAYDDGETESTIYPDKESDIILVPSSERALQHARDEHLKDLPRGYRIASWVEIKKRVNFLRRWLSIKEDKIARKIGMDKDEFNHMNSTTDLQDEYTEYFEPTVRWVYAMDKSTVDRSKEVLESLYKITAESEHPVPYSTFTLWTKLSMGPKERKSVDRRLAIWLNTPAKRNKPTESTSTGDDDEEDRGGGSEGKGEGEEKGGEGEGQGDSEGMGEEKEEERNGGGEANGNSNDRGMSEGNGQKEPNVEPEERTEIPSPLDCHSTVKISLNDKEVEIQALQGILDPSAKLEAVEDQNIGCHIINAGGPIHAMEWISLPKPPEGSTGDPPKNPEDLESQYLTVSASVGEQANVIRKRYSHHGFIQLWRIPTGVPIPKQPATLALSLTHTSGCALALKWNPGICSSIRAPKSSVASRERGLGLLAAVFTDGSVQVFDVPHPEALESKGNGPRTLPLAPILRMVLPGMSVPCCVAWSSPNSLKSREESRTARARARKVTQGVTSPPHSNIPSQLAVGTTEGDAIVWSLHAVDAEKNSAENEISYEAAMEFEERVCEINTATKTISFSPYHPSLIVTAGEDGFIRAYDLRDPYKPLVERTTSSPVTQIEWIKDTSILAVSEDNLLILNILDEKFQYINFPSMSDEDILMGISLKKLNVRRGGPNFLCVAAGYSSGAVDIGGISLEVGKKSQRQKSYYQESYSLNGVEKGNQGIPILSLPPAGILTRPWFLRPDAKAGPTSTPERQRGRGRPKKGEKFVKKGPYVKLPKKPKPKKNLAQVESRYIKMSILYVHIVIYIDYYF
ncbi:hypothetical protein AAMO2058_001078800 [Amorphochlora amoebiformis]